MKTAVIFSGQGSQYTGMGKSFFENSTDFTRIIEEASQYAGFDIKKHMLESDESTLSQTQIIQPVMSAYCYGLITLLRKTGFTPIYSAGLSLGEYSALALSEVFDLKTLISLTAFRGRKMAEAAKGLDAKMLAVIGAEPDCIQKICEDINETTEEKIYISNYNSKVQTVISGTNGAIEIAKEKLKNKNAKCIPLKVSSAFHTPFMEPAGSRLKEYFKDIDFKEEKIPVIFNLTGKPRQENEDIALLLEKQVSCPVKMCQSIEYMAEAGVSKVIEAGTGKVISGFIKKTAPEIQTFTTETYDEFQEAMEKISEA